MEYGGQTMCGRLRSVLVRPPQREFSEADPADWHYTARPSLEAAWEEHRRLVELLESDGVEVVRHDAELPGLADSLFVFDPVLITDRGAVALRMGKELRRGEEEALAGRLAELGVPLLGRLTGEARAEGGDLLWVDRATLAVGQGFRTNREGLRQLRLLLEPLGVELLPVELPHHHGPDACLHLGSLISLVDRDLAVVHRPLLPVRFVEALAERRIALVDVPADELDGLGPNVLAVAPRRCIALEGNPETRAGLEAAGCTVRTYRGDELSLKAEGGATCLTLPLRRDPVPATARAAGAR